MAKIKANKRPVKIRRKNRNRTFTGTCSNCGDKKVDIIKVGSIQVCLDKCLKLERFGIQEGSVPSSAIDPNDPIQISVGG